MEVGWYEKYIDFERLVGVLVIGTCPFLRPGRQNEGDVTASDYYLESEVDYAIHLADRVISHDYNKAPKCFGPRKRPDMMTY